MVDSTRTIEYTSEGTNDQRNKQKSTTIIIIVVVLLLLCCCCTVVALVLAWFYGDAVLEMLNFELTYLSRLALGG